MATKTSVELLDKSVLSVRSSDRNNGQAPTVSEIYKDAFKSMTRGTTPNYTTSRAMISKPFAGAWYEQPAATTSLKRPMTSNNRRAPISTTSNENIHETAAIVIPARPLLKNNATRNVTQECARSQVLQKPRAEKFVRVATAADNYRRQHAQTPLSRHQEQPL